MHSSAAEVIMSAVYAIYSAVCATNSVQKRIFSDICGAYLSGSAIFNKAYVRRKTHSVLENARTFMIFHPKTTSSNNSSITMLPIFSRFPMPHANTYSACYKAVIGVLLFCALVHLSATTAPAQETAHSQIASSRIIEGNILDSATGEAIVGASVRIIGRNVGTYSTAKGWFRLPLQESNAAPVTLRVSSLGYKPFEYRLTGDNTAATLTLRLSTSPITLGSVEVRALSAEDIVRRAIAARAENAGNLLSSTKTLYTKINGFGAFKLPFRDEQRQQAIVETIARVEDNYKPTREQKTTILQRRQTANVPVQDNVFTYNQFFNFQDDNIKIGSARLVTPLSGTAPTVYQYDFLGQKPDGNGGLVFLIGFKPRSAAFPAFEGQLSISDKNYALVEANFRPVHVSIPFVESLSYQQKFTEYTAAGQNIWIPTYLHFQLKAATQAAMGAVKAFGEFSAQTIVQDVTINAAPATLSSAGASSSQHTVPNTPPSVSNLAPSKVKKLSPRATTTVVANNADSSKAEFWEKNSLYALSAEELATYRRVDSVQLVQDSIKRVTPPKPASERRTGTTIRFSLSVGGGGIESEDDESSDLNIDASTGSGNSSRKKSGTANSPSAATTPPMSGMLPFSPNGLFPISITTGATLGINPILNFTRTTNLFYGIELLPHLYDTTGRSILAVSLRGALDGNTPERRRFWGEAGAMLEVFKWDDTTTDGSVNLYGSAYSRLSAIQERRLASTLAPFNVNLDYLAFGHHFDFYREDGWTAGAGLVLGGLRLSASRSEARNFSLENTPERSNAGDRTNLGIQAGTIRAWRMDADWNYGAVLSPFTPLSSERVQFGIKVAAELGDESTSAVSYSKAEAGAFLLLPTFATGYSPMAFLLTLSTGLASASTPIQKQFVAMRRYAVLGATHDLMSTPVNAFGGTQFAQARLEHNFSDLWWRALRLPLIRERGLEFSIFANAAWYANTSTTAGILRSTPSGSAYSELGFGIDRIPTFVLDFLFLRFDAAWGLGDHAVNSQGVRNFGFTVSTHISLQ